MTVFRVGQRVRIKWSKNWPELAGEAGTIVGRGSDCADSGRGEWDVSPDAWGDTWAPCRGVFGANSFAPGSDQLEPLTDSYDLVSWESMRELWMPEHLREVA